MGNKTQRNISFDVLRILAAFSVVLLHTSAAYINMAEVGTVPFRLANAMNSFSRFGVPIFVMISGAIFLSEDKKITVKKLWLGNILRMLVLFGIWSFGYYVYQSLYLWDFDFWRQGIVRTIVGMVYASDHFWFFFMIMGLYALVPILRTWVQHAEKKELDYFLVLFVVYQIIRTTVINLLDKSLILKLADMFKIIELTGYLGYFVLGYVLMKYGVSDRVKRILGIMIPIGMLANYFISDYMSLKTGVYSPGIYDSFGIFTFAHVVALFVFVNDYFSKITVGPTLSKWISEIALDTLGIYVMHVGLLLFLKNEGFVFESFSPIGGSIILAVICFVVCGVVAAFLRRIPFVGKYIC